MADDGQPGLPPFQLEVARMFFKVLGGPCREVLCEQRCSLPDGHPQR